jgi:hypothetical protein
VAVIDAMPPLEVREQPQASRPPLRVVGSRGAILGVRDESKVNSSRPVQVQASVVHGRSPGARASRIIAGAEDPVGFQVQVIHDGASRLT